MIRYDDAKLESFLLDELPSAEREEIEQRLFADHDLFARVEELETDLADAYVSDELSPEMRLRFERSLEFTPSRREKVVFARLLGEKLPRKRQGADVLPFSGRRTTVFRGALAAALLAIVIGVPMMIRQVERTRDAEPVPVANTVDTADIVSNELPTATDSAATATLPRVVSQPSADPAAAETDSKTTAVRKVTFVLSTINLRSGAGINTLEIAEDVSQVVLRLALESDEFATYNVDIRSSAGTSVWGATRLPVSTLDGGPALSFEIPADTLESGRHELVLAGVHDRGTEEVAYVDFLVDRR